MSEPIRVIVLRVDKETGIAQPPVVETLAVDPDGDGHLAAMQKIVGGLVECVGGFDGRGTDLWCNEEGLLLDLPFNRVIPAPATPEPPSGVFDFVIYGDSEDGRLARPGEPGEWRIRGDFFISRVTPDGELASVTDDDVAHYLDLFHSPKETP